MRDSEGEEKFRATVGEIAEDFAGAYAAKLVVSVIIAIGRLEYSC